jgi:pimeloyl-ACP methyl ester carboxylesterase
MRLWRLTETERDFPLKGDRQVRKFRSIFTAACALLSMLPLSSEASVAQRHVAANAVFDSGILRVERFGADGGRPLIFVPALFCGSWEWNAQINALSSKYDVFVVTLPGFDGRPMVSDDALMERAARDLHLLIETRDLKRPIVIGHSLGGTLTVFFAERYPNDAAGIVTIEGGYPVAPTQAMRDARVARTVKPFEGITRSELGPALRKNMLQYTITSTPDVNTVERLAARSDPGAIAAWLRAALTLDLTPALSSIKVPFTAIVPFDKEIDPFQGFKSREQKQAAYVRWVSHARYGKVIVIDNSRHFVMFDQPTLFAQALESALSR